MVDNAYQKRISDFCKQLRLEVGLKLVSFQKGLITADQLGADTLFAAVEAADKIQAFAEDNTQLYLVAVPAEFALGQIPDPKKPEDVVVRLKLSQAQKLQDFLIDKQDVAMIDVLKEVSDAIGVKFMEK